MAKKAKETVAPVSYVHVDEFLSARSDIALGIKAGFKVFMKGRAYQNSFDKFNTELDKYLGKKK